MLISTFKSLKLLARNKYVALKFRKSDYKYAKLCEGQNYS